MSNDTAELSASIKMELFNNSAPDQPYRVHVIGSHEISGGLNLVCTDQATAEVIASAMSRPAIIIAEAELAVATKALCEQYPRAKFIICGDLSDHGKVLAEKAARAVAAELALPKFSPSYHRGADETTFYHLNAAEGPGAVRSCIEFAEDFEIYEERVTRPANAELVEKIEGRILELAAFDPTSYELVREAEAKAFDIRVSYLDRRVEERRKANAASLAASAKKDVAEETWPAEVDGAELLSELTGAVQECVIVTKQQALGIVLWIVHSHATDASDVSPILAILSPVMRCGKTRLLNFLERLVPKPLTTSNISVASLYYQIDQKQPTLLIDEADAFVHVRGELRGILNAGHSRSNAFVRRLHYKKGVPVPVEYNVWGAKAVAAIGRLPNTLMDRSIKISMRRKLPGEVVKKIEPLTLGNLKQKAARWAADNLVPLKARSVEHLEGLNDRACDNWRPLLAIADQCNDEWGREARGAALAIEPSLEAQNALELLEQEDAVRLLADCRMAFAGRDELSAADLIKSLCSLPESEWKEWRYRKPITPKALSILLAKFKIFSRKGGPRNDRKRYFRADFEAHWRAYILPQD